MGYAEGTSVTIERSIQEIDRMVGRAGATQFAYGRENMRAAITFVIKERQIRFILKLPDMEKFRATPSGKKQRSDAETYRNWEQGCKERWRALALCIKAKLESVATGIEEFDEAFLPQIVLAGQHTVWEHVQQSLPDAASGKRQLLALPAPKRKDSP